MATETKKEAFTTVKLTRSRVRDLYGALKACNECPANTTAGYALARTGLKIRDEVEAMRLTERSLFKTHDTDNDGKLKDGSADALEFSVAFNDFLSENIEVSVVLVSEEELAKATIPVSAFMELGPLIKPPEKKET